MAKFEPGYTEVRWGKRKVGCWLVARRPTRACLAPGPLLAAWCKLHQCAPLSKHLFLGIFPYFSRNNKILIRFLSNLFNC